MKYDFCGWATRNNIECSDGRTIMKDAFIDNDGKKVPLVWNHQHNDPNEVLGHALLENREDGVYAYCKFNNTESGRTAKELVVNGDVSSLSIYANRLQSKMNKVVHGCIREVSLVLAGANPGAYIETVVAHSDNSENEEETTIYMDEPISVIEHSDDELSEEEIVDDLEGGEKMDNKEVETEEVKTTTEEVVETNNQVDNSDADNKETENNEVENTEIEHSDKEKSIEEVFNTLTDEQKDAV